LARYDLVLTGPGDKKIEAVVAAGEGYSVQAALGEWSIDAKAYNAENALIGTGSAAVTVKAGKNEALIPMRAVPSPDVPPDDAVIAVTGVGLNKTATAILVGGTETLFVTITPSNATNQNVTWSSSNTAMAAVNNGEVSAVAEGTAVITVTTEDGGFTAACTVTVSSTAVAVTGVSLNTGTLSLAVGGTGTLTAVITPSNATNQTVFWSSSNTAVAAVTDGGVTAAAAGTAIITVTTEDGEFSATCTVTVIGAEQLATELNAITPGCATASGQTVTLDNDLTLTNTTITVPSGVTLDLVTNHKSITLGNDAVLTVNGVVNAEASYDSSNVVIAANGKLLVNSAAGSAATINGAGVVHFKRLGQLLGIENGKGLILDGTVTLDGLMTAATAESKNITLPADYADDIDTTYRVVRMYYSGSTFTMRGGVIGYNAARGVFSNGVFNMYGGEIKNNCVFGGSYKQGAGIYVGDVSVFTMYGGEIKGNDAEDEGGGIYITAGGQFHMKKDPILSTGGMVYGSSAGPGLANITGASGASLSNIGGTAKWDDGTGIATTEGTINGTTQTIE
jgi:uncharacterized protein YjdB